MKETDIHSNTVGEIVALDYRTASVFKEAGIDFCCGGKKTIAESCAEKNIDPGTLISKLRNVDLKSGPAVHNFKDWDPVFLSDYIINVHHSFIRKTLPELSYYTSKIALVHGENHPELSEVASLFARISDELKDHLEKEETILFPAIRKAGTEGDLLSKQVILNELAGLSEEHESAGSAMDRINLITGSYKLPEDACNTYRVAFELLERFEDDLHTHVHLENNILFPRALKLSDN
jgi:regulator of cell morphogenesis and NO signaling